MATTPWIPLVSVIKNQTQVSAEVVNPVLSQLAQREQHLYEKFTELADKSSLIASGVLVDTTAYAALTNGTPVYFSATGLQKAQVGYINTTLTTAYFDPSDSSFVYGLIKTKYVNPSNPAQYLADVYVSGKVVLDSSVAGLYQSGDGAFEIGPLYLSRAESGKFAKNPSGLAAYVGYSISATELLLNPKINELSKILTQYSDTLLDRIAGTPSLTTTTWTIVSPDYTKVGWISAANAASNYGITAPVDAKFYYNIPNGLLTSLTYDSVLTAAEATDAQDLKLNFPPTPAYYNSLYSNGVLQIQAHGGYTTDGVYLVDNSGIWWTTDQNGTQPWASNVLTEIPSYTAASWTAYKASSNISAYRKRMVLNFSKANPEFKQLVVTSVAPANSTSLSIVDAVTGAVATSGDVQVKLLLPTNVSATTASATAISGITYNGTSGNLDLVTTPSISSITGIGGISTSTDGLGAVTISTQSSGLSGQVLSLEPRGGTTLEYIGLSSYLRFKNNLNHSVIGKFQLPASIPATDVQIQLYMFGEGVIPLSATTDIKFEYSVGAPASLIPSGSLVSSLLSTSTVSSTITLTMGTGYAANTLFVNNTQFVIPAAAFCASSLVNFKITRLTSSGYTGNLGVVGFFWKFL